MGPSSGRLTPPRGQRAWVGRAAAANPCQKVFLLQGHPLRWAAEPVLPIEGLPPFFGSVFCFSTSHQAFTSALLWVQRFSSPTSISPPGAFEPQSHWLLVLEHALRFSSTHLLPMIHPPPLAQVIYAKPQTTSRKSPDIEDPILTPVYFSPAPLV